jgi:hypothetical protein
MKNWEKKEKDFYFKKEGKCFQWEASICPLGGAVPVLTYDVTACTWEAHSSPEGATVPPPLCKSYSLFPLYRVAMYVVL